MAEQNLVALKSASWASASLLKPQNALWELERNRQLDNTLFVCGRVGFQLKRPWIENRLLSYNLRTHGT